MAEPPTKFILEMQSTGLGDSEIIERLQERGYTQQDINDGFNQAKVKATIKTGEYNPGQEMPTNPAAEDTLPRTLPAPADGQIPTTTPALPATPIPPATQNPIQQQPMQPEQDPMQQRQPATPQPSQEYYQAPAPADNYGYEPEVGQQGYSQYGEEYGNQEGYQDEGAYSVETFEEIVEAIVEERWRAFIEKIGDIQGWKDTVDRELVRVDKRIERIDETLNSINAALLERVGEYGKNIKTLGSDVKAVEKALSQILEPLMRNVRELKGVTEKLKGKKRTSSKK